MAVANAPRHLLEPHVSVTAASVEVPVSSPLARLVPLPSLELPAPRFALEPPSLEPLPTHAPDTAPVVRASREVVYACVRLATTGLAALHDAHRQAQVGLVLQMVFAMWLQDNADALHHGVAQIAL